MRRSLFVRLSCFIIVIYVTYGFYLLSASDDELFKKVDVEKYTFSDANYFRMDPFYKKGSYDRKESDVTLITQVSPDRLSRLVDMSASWSGPISAAVYVKDAEEELPIIDELVATSESVREFVDFHILYANKTRYPVNNLRNMALLNSRTPLIMILDADFVTSKNMHDYLSEVGQREILNNDKKQVYVVPAFSSDLRPHKLPKTKSDLLRAVSSRTVIPVNEKICPKCHGPTNYKRWYDATEPYNVLYRWIYEPYLMLNKDHLAELFDERLKGYGFDKNSHVFTLATYGYEFIVLPDPFVIHMNHETADWDGGNLLEQQFESLKIVCDILPSSKQKNGLNPDFPYFGEPVGDKECMSRDHW